MSIIRDEDRNARTTAIFSFSIVGENSLCSITDVEIKASLLNSKTGDCRTRELSGPCGLTLSYLEIVGAKRRRIVTNWLLGVLFFGYHSGLALAHDTLVIPIKIVW